VVFVWVWVWARAMTSSGGRNPQRIMLMAPFCSGGGSFRGWFSAGTHISQSGLWAGSFRVTS
jgi:hypothetical protein